MTQNSPRTRFGWQLMAALIILIVGFSLGVPPVRAALRGWLGLSVAPVNQMPAAALTLVPMTLPAPTASSAAANASTAGPSNAATAAAASVPTQVLSTESAFPLPTATAAASDKPAEVSQLASQVNWDILTASSLPEGYKFESAYYDAGHQMVILTYLVTRPLPGAADPSLTSSHSITLLQALKNDFVPMQTAPQAKIEDIQVNGASAAYTVGAWDSEFVPDSTDPNGGKMVYTWRSDLNVKNIYWQAGQVFLSLVTDDEAVSKDTLIKMAQGVGK